MIKACIENLEHEDWEARVGSDINDPPASAYSIVHTPAGLVLLMNSFVPYGGWLAKAVSPLLFPARYITFRHSLLIDDATAVAAQVIETDSKITDEYGWTFDLSSQWNIAKGWMLEIDNEEWTWTDTNVTIPPLRPLIPVEIEFEYELDYAAHRSAILQVTVGNNPYLLEPQTWISAREVGWAPSQIVTQLQQVNNSQPGGYGLRFSEIGYELR